ncbi:hypothetical protein RSAG8_11142, partial [Rhizoctonia solani AG-8 WAC10335]
MLFMTIDLLGGVFSALSLVFRETFDTFAAIPYLFVFVLDGLVIALTMVLKPLARRRRRRQVSNEGQAEAQEHTDRRYKSEKGKESK